MKKITLIMSSLLAIAACNDMIAPENASVADGDGIAYFVSTMEGNDATTVEDDTKTVLSSDGQYRVFWEETDYISIYDGTVAHQYKATPYADARDNNTTAYFYPTQENLVLPSGKEYYALYPHDEAAEWNGSKVTFKIPEVQTAVANDFPYNASVAVSDGNELKFRNVGSLIKFSFTGSGYRRVLFEAVGGEPLAGTVTVDCLSPESVDADAGLNTLTLKGASDANTYYATVLPANFSRGLKIVVFTARGYQSSNTSSFDLLRSYRVEMGQFLKTNTGFQGAWQGISDQTAYTIKDDDIPGGYYYPLACGIDVAGANLEGTTSKCWNDFCDPNNTLGEETVLAVQTIAPVNPCPEGWNLPTYEQIEKLQQESNFIIDENLADFYWKMRDGSYCRHSVLWGKNDLKMVSSVTKEGTKGVYNWWVLYEKDETTAEYKLKNNRFASQDRNKTYTNNSVAYRCVREAQQ